MGDGRDHDKVLAALNSASAKARATWVTLLLFGTYLAVAVGATTHRDLFLESPVTLPLLNAELPLFSFYIVAPALFVVMHLYMLVNLYLLGRKIEQFEAALPDDLAEADQEPLRAQLDSFLVLQKLAGRVRGGVPRFLLNLTVWITVIGGPVLLVLAFQVRFLPYHSEAVTWWHRVLILVDTAMLWLLWPSTVHPSGRNPAGVGIALSGLRALGAPHQRGVARAGQTLDGPGLVSCSEVSGALGLAPRGGSGHGAATGAAFGGHLSVLSDGPSLDFFLASCHRAGRRGGGMDHCQRVV